MSGKMPKAIGSLEAAFSKQIEFQKGIAKKYQSHLSDGSIPVDNPALFQYHITAMMEELGEVLKADKRWKTHRNEDFNLENKMDEIADCYITLFNITMFSGVTHDQIAAVINDKIARNAQKAF